MIKDEFSCISNDMRTEKYIYYYEFNVKIGDKDFLKKYPNYKISVLLKSNDLK